MTAVLAYVAAGITGLWGVAHAVPATGSGTGVAAWVYRVAAGLLLALAVLTGLTGARTPVIWFRICPVLLTCPAVLLLLASGA